MKEPHQSWVGGPAQATARRIVTLVVAGGLALGTGSCARVGADSMLRPDKAADVATRLVDLYEQVNGSLKQRAAVEKLTYIAYQGAIEHCLSQAGYRYSPPPFVNPYEGRAHLRLSIDLPALIEPGAANHLDIEAETARAAQAEARVAAHRNPEYEHLSGAERRRYSDQVTKCEPPTDTYVDAFVPRASLELDAPLGERLREVQDSSSVRTASQSYATCLRDHGVSATSLGALEKQVRAMFEPQPGAAVAGGLSLRQEAEEFQHKASEADAECRHNTWVTAMTELKPVLATFTEEHADALRSLTEAWATVETRAEQSRPEMEQLSPGS